MNKEKKEEMTVEQAKEKLEQLIANVRYGIRVDVTEYEQALKILTKPARQEEPRVKEDVREAIKLLRNTEKSTGNNRMLILIGREDYETALATIETALTQPEPRGEVKEAIDKLVNAFTLGNMGEKYFYMLTPTEHKKALTTIESALTTPSEPDREKELIRVCKEKKAECSMRLCRVLYEDRRPITYVWIIKIEGMNIFPHIFVKNESKPEAISSAIKELESGKGE